LLWLLAASKKLLLLHQHQHQLLHLLLLQPQWLKLLLAPPLLLQVPLPLLALPLVQPQALLLTLLKPLLMPLLALPLVLLKTQWLLALALLTLLRPLQALPLVLLPALLLTLPRKLWSQRSNPRGFFFHEKSALGRFFHFRAKAQSLAITTENSKQSQQTLEDVKDIHVESQRRSDVIRLAAVDDLLQVIEHVSGKNADTHHADHSHADSRTHENIDDAADEHSQCTHHQPFAHAR
jgi:hypothetical protein